jgi:hypothetical protein
MFRALTIKFVHLEDFQGKKQEQLDKCFEIYNCFQQHKMAILLKS